MAALLYKVGNEMVGVFFLRPCLPVTVSVYYNLHLCLFVCLSTRLLKILSCERIFTKFLE